MVLKKILQLGRRRIEPGRVPFLTHPPPICQDSSFPEWVR